MHGADELACLEEAIDVCRATITEQEEVLDRLRGKAGQPEVERLLALYQNLLECQLKRRDELLAHKDG